MTTEQEPSPEPSALETAVRMNRRARRAILRRQYDEATALATTATSLVLTAWALGDPEMSPTIPCSPSALQGTPPGIKDDPVEQRKRSGVVPVQAESQAEAWERFKR